MQAIGNSRAVIAPSLQDFPFVQGSAYSFHASFTACCADFKNSTHPLDTKGERQSRVVDVPSVQVTTVPECHLQGKES